MFDRDEHPHFKEAVELCRNKGVGVGRSDPCFELWLILHERDYDRPDDRHAVQAELRRLRPEYEMDGAKTPDCDDLITRVEDAERRGEEQLRRRAQQANPFGNRSTTLGQLTSAIREAAELDQRTAQSTISPRKWRPLNSLMPQPLAADHADTSPSSRTLQQSPPGLTSEEVRAILGARSVKGILITTQAKRNLSSRSGIGGVLSAT